jgi:hypothetical protein
MMMATVMITSHSILLRMITISDKSSTENHNTILLSVNSFQKTDNGEKYGRTRQATDDNIIQCTHSACSIT